MKAASSTNVMPNTPIQMAQESYPHNVPNALRQLNLDVYNTFINYAHADVRPNVLRALDTLSKLEDKIRNEIPFTTLLRRENSKSINLTDTIYYRKPEGELPISAEFRNVAQELQPVMESNRIPEGYDRNQPFIKIKTEFGSYYTNEPHRQASQIPHFREELQPMRVASMQARIDMINTLADLIETKESH